MFIFSDSAGTENTGCYYGEMDLQNRKVVVLFLFLFYFSCYVNDIKK